MKLILIDPNKKLYLAWEKSFKDLPNVEIVVGSFENLLEFDCMVSAANSFGLMDGGVDGAITRFFGPALQERVQKTIIGLYHGEQPAGTSAIIRTENAEHPYLAHTPTMRVPMPIAGTDAVYRAMQAMLLSVRWYNSLIKAADWARVHTEIETIACPGLGTGTGCVPPDEAASQMALAYKHFLNPPGRLSWEFARERQAAVANTMKSALYSE